MTINVSIVIANLLAHTLMSGKKAIYHNKQVIGVDYRSFDNTADLVVL